MNSRVIIEQAKGVIAQAHNVSVDQALTLLRAHARNTNQRLGDVAFQIVTDPAQPARLRRPAPDEPTAPAP